jgi:hypothetical protein
MNLRSTWLAALPLAALIAIGAAGCSPVMLSFAITWFDPVSRRVGLA